MPYLTGNGPAGAAWQTLNQTRRRQVTFFFFQHKSRKESQEEVVVVGGGILSCSVNICSVILSQSRITSNAHDRTQRERERERESWLISFSYFLFGYETKRAKVGSCSLSSSAWQDTGEGHEGDRWQMKTIASAKAKEIKYRKRKRSGRARRGGTREKKGNPLSNWKGNVFFVKEEMKRLEKGQLLAGCLLLLARRRLASFWKLSAFVSLSCISGSTLTTATTRVNDRARYNHEYKTRHLKTMNPSSLHSATYLAFQEKSNKNL